ncbi:hypothetical protein AB0L63_27280 [Nocardia sp. NPDC051990]|uniref:hypothetical protein n=1 Tax=Nocardia sp. NPDC051990 TaxID=3155285 RepID=UPI00341CCA23
MRDFDNGYRNRMPARTRSARMPLRRSTSRPSAEEVLLRSRVERAQLDQARLFQAMLVEEAQQLHEELRALHEELREVYRQLGNLRRRFSSLPAVPRPAGYQPVVPPPSPRPRPNSASA